MASVITISNESLKDYLVRKFNNFAHDINSNKLTEAAIATALTAVTKDLQDQLESTHPSALEKGQALLYASQQLAICSAAHDESYRFYLQTIATLLDEEDIELVINEHGSSIVYELALSVKHQSNTAELLPKYLERINNKEEIIFQLIINPVNLQQNNDVITTCIKIENTAALTKLLPYIKTKASKDQCWQQLVASNQEELIVNALKIDWLSEDDKNEYLLTEARAGNSLVVKLLLDNGARVDHQDRYGYTALMYAAVGGHTATAQLLLEKDAKINHQDIVSGCTALIYAASNGHAETLKLLLEKGANIDHQNQDGSTALIRAARGGHTAIVELLLEKGANIEHQNRYGFTALIYSALWGRTATLKLLLDNRANIDYQAGDRYTALMMAARTGNSATLTLLLDRGADVALINAEGKTALELAQGDCLKILQEHMASNSRPRP